MAVVQVARVISKGASGWVVVVIIIVVLGPVPVQSMGLGRVAIIGESKDSAERPRHGLDRDLEHRGTEGPVAEEAEDMPEKQAGCVGSLAVFSHLLEGSLLDRASPSATPDRIGNLGDECPPKDGSCYGGLDNVSPMEDHRQVVFEDLEQVHVEAKGGCCEDNDDPSDY